MNRFRSLLFPLALALILGIITAWLGRASEVSVEETALDPAKPQYTATNLHAKRFDISGSLNRRPACFAVSRGTPKPFGEH